MVSPINPNQDLPSNKGRPPTDIELSVLVNPINPNQDLRSNKSRPLMTEQQRLERLTVQQEKGRAILKAQREALEEQKASEALKKSQTPSRAHVYLGKMSDCVKQIAACIMKNPISAANGYMTLSVAASYVNLKLLGKHVAKAEQLVGTGVLQNGYECYCHDQLKKRLKAIDIEISAVDDKLFTKPDKVSIEKLEEQKAVLWEEYYSIKKHVDAEGAILKSNMLESTASLAGYTAGVVGKAAVVPIPAWILPGISIATSVFSTGRTINALYNCYKSYKAIKNEIDECNSTIKQLESQVQELNELLNIDSSPSEKEQKIVAKKISDLKTKIVVYKQRQISLEKIIKTDWKTNFISEVQNLVLSLLGIVAGIGLLVGAPYLAIPLYACMGVVYGHKVVSLLMTGAIAAYKYFRPKKKENPNAEKEFLIYGEFRAKKSSQMKESDLVICLSNLFNGMKDDEINRASISDLKRRVSKNHLESAKGRRINVPSLYSPPSKRMKEDKYNQSSSEELKHKLAEKLGLYNHQGKIDPSRLHLYDDKGNIDTKSEQFKKIIEWANGALI